MEDVQAPFSADAVRAVNAFHASGAGGALTCPAPLHDEDPQHPATLLFATKAALVCPDPDCGYRQLWAPAYAVHPMTEPQWSADEQVADARTP